jgi:hypothetical protein
MSNEETKKAADELIEVFSNATPYFLSHTSAIHHAIASTENTIKVLERIKQTDKYNCKELHIPTQIELDQQTELLNELKTRL